MKEYRLKFKKISFGNDIMLLLVHQYPCAFLGYLELKSAHCTF